MDRLILNPGDIILFDHSCSKLLRVPKEWLLGSRWGHVSVFWGVADLSTGQELLSPYRWEVAQGTIWLPLHVEAIGRGTLKTNLLLSGGRYVKVLRHHDAQAARDAALEAGNFARQGQRRYDRPVIVRCVVPYLVARRVLQVDCGFWYSHNEQFICSEMADAAYKYTLFDDNCRFPTLPGDYEYAKDLETVWEGVL